MINSDDLTTRRLLALYWLQGNERTFEINNSDFRLEQFAINLNIKLPEAVYKKAAEQLNSAWADGDIELWVTSICFRSHPHFVWNFMLDTVALAKSDDHLAKIANDVALHILAHYGSMIVDFEEHACIDQKFKRMLTGVWRHRMSDNVWQRLRKIQSEVFDPLKCMLPLEYGVEYMAHKLSPEDRANADKGPYFKAYDGSWQKN